VRLNLRLEVHTDKKGVVDAETRISQLQNNVTPRVFQEPQPGWSAG
jgi:hypothetical protein